MQSLPAARSCQCSSQYAGPLEVARRALRYSARRELPRALPTSQAALDGSRGAAAELLDRSQKVRDGWRKLERVLAVIRRSVLCMVSSPEPMFISSMASKSARLPATTTVQGLPLEPVLMAHTPVNSVTPQHVGVCPSRPCCACWHCAVLLPQQPCKARVCTCSSSSV